MVMLQPPGKPLLLSLISLLAVLQIAACDDDSGGGIDLERAREFAEIRCAKLFECCNPTGAYDDETDCVESTIFGFWYLDYLGVSVDPDRMAACLDARIAQVSGECTNEYRRSLDECALVFHGPLGVGRACTLVEQCGSGLYCKPTEADVNTRYCAPKKDEGSACDRNLFLSSAECGSGLICLEQATGDRCKAPLPPGTSCTRSYECGSEYSLDAICVFGRCGARLPDDADCDPDHPEWCLSGHCDPDAPVCTPETLQEYCEDMNE